MFRDKSRVLIIRSFVTITVICIILIGPKNKFDANAAEPYTLSSLYIEYPNNEANNHLILNTWDQKNGNTGVSETIQGLESSFSGSGATGYGINRAYTVADLYEDKNSVLTGYAQAMSEYKDWLIISNPALTGQEGQAFFHFHLTGTATGQAHGGYYFNIGYPTPYQKEYGYSLDSSGEDNVSCNEVKILPFTFIYGSSYRVYATLSVSASCNFANRASSASFQNSAEIVKIDIPTGATLTSLSGHKYPTNASNYFLYLPIIIH